MGNPGNAEKLRSMGQWGNFSGKIGNLLWPVFKSEIEQGRVDVSSFKDSDIRAALRRGFLHKVKDDFGLDINDIGKVSRDQLAKLSVWNLKNLYQLFYLRNFGLYLEFPDELMPTNASDKFAWPICVPGIISNEATYQSGNLDIPRWKWTRDPLDGVLDLSCGRDAWARSFIIRVRPNWEADEDLKNLSANDIERQSINTLGLRERLILGAFLFWLTGDHLDRKTVTLCAGSPFLHGDVPVVDFDSRAGRVRVYHCHPGRSCGALRARQIVS